MDDEERKSLYYGFKNLYEDARGVRILPEEPPPPLKRWELARLDGLTHLST